MRTEATEINDDVRRPDGREHKRERPATGRCRDSSAATARQRGIKRLKRRANIAIAVLVPKVVFKKRLSGRAAERLVVGRFRLPAAVERSVCQIA